MKYNTTYKAYRQLVLNTVMLALLVSSMACNPGTIQTSVEEIDENTFVNPYVHLLEMDADELGYEELYNRALNLWDVPFEEVKCETRYGQANILVTGPEDGTPVVLLHGLNASSTMWYPNIEDLSKQHRIYAIDFFLEINKSENTGETTSTDDVVDWYNQVLDCLNIHSFHLVGASRGGWLGTNIALKHPDKILSLSLLSPAQTLKWIPPGKDMLSNILYTLNPKAENMQEALKTLSADPMNIEDLYLDLFHKATQEGSLSTGILEMRPFSKSELESLRMPLLVLIGDDDFINDESSLEEARAHIPNVQAEIVPQAGHFLSIDQAELVNTKILDFIASK